MRKKGIVLFDEILEGALSNKKLVKLNAQINVSVTHYSFTPGKKSINQLKSTCDKRGPLLPLNL